MLLPAFQIQVGDHIDLENDLYADPNRDHEALFSNELQVVSLVNQETKHCVAIYFEGFDRVGFPTAHLLSVKGHDNGLR